MQQFAGLHGDAGVGKDTVGAILARTHGAYRLAFADKLKEEASAAFGVTVEFLNRRETKEVPLPQLAPMFCRDPAFVLVLKEVFGNKFHPEMPLSPRRITQLWGTEYRRSQDPHYWVNRLDESARALPEDAIIAITDVREEFEVDYVKNRGGVVLIVDALPETRKARNGVAKVHSHSSENGIRMRANMMAKVWNDGTIEELERASLSALASLGFPRTSQQSRLTETIQRMCPTFA